MAQGQLLLWNSACLTCLSWCIIKGILFVLFPKLIKVIRLMFEYNMICKQRTFKQLTVNDIFEPLDFEKPRCHKVSRQHVFVHAGGPQGAKDRKQKVPSAHYGTKITHPMYKGWRSQVDGFPASLWIYGSDLRWDAEERSSHHSRVETLLMLPRHIVKRKIPQKTERNNWDQVEEIRSLSSLHFLAEDQPLIRRVLLHRGQQEVGGLLASPLITLNDSNGHSFEIKSTYSRAHMHIHTGHSHANLALHSDRLLHWPSSWNGWLLWASFTSSRVRRKHLDYYFYFSFLYSQRTV